MGASSSRRGRKRRSLFSGSLETEGIAFQFDQSEPNAFADMQSTSTRERSSPSSIFAGMLSPGLIYPLIEPHLDPVLAQPFRDLTMVLSLLLWLRTVVVLEWRLGHDKTPTSSGCLGTGLEVHGRSNFDVLVRMVTTRHRGKPPSGRQNRQPFAPIPRTCSILILKGCIARSRLLQFGARFRATRGVPRNEGVGRGQSARPADGTRTGKEG